MTDLLDGRRRYGGAARAGLRVESEGRSTAAVVVAAAEAGRWRVKKIR
jgi:hypothetical protein